LGFFTSIYLTKKIIFYSVSSSKSGHDVILSHQFHANILPISKL